MKDLYVEKIGNILKQKRDENIYTIDDVSAATKINPAYIAALESGDLDIFPAAVFLKGFLKSYSVFLGINPDPILKEYSELAKETPAQNYGQGDTSAVDKKRKLMSAYLKYGALIGIGLVIVFSWLRVGYLNYKSKADLEKRKSASFKTITTAKEMAMHEEKKRLIGFGEKKENLIVVKAVKDCWVEVKYQNNSIFQGLLFAGEAREFSYKKGLLLKLGNAGGVELTVNGHVRKDLGKSGEVREILID